MVQKVMDANQYALVHGMRSTRTTLERWQREPLPVLAGVAAGAALIGIVPADVRPRRCDQRRARPRVRTTSRAAPTGSRPIAPRRRSAPTGSSWRSTRSRASPGFIAGSALPLSASKREGLSRWVHERARPVAFAWIVSVTAFSLIAQAVALGVIGSTLADSAEISPALLVLTVLPHALLELTAVFLPARRLDDRQPPRRMGPAARRDGRHGDGGDPDAPGLGGVGGPGLALPAAGRLARSLTRPAGRSSTRAASCRRASG